MATQTPRMWTDSGKPIPYPNFPEGTAAAAKPYERNKHFKSALELRNMRDADLPRDEWEEAKDYRDSKD